MPMGVPPVADERDGLLAYLAQQRCALRATAYGLTDDQARMSTTASDLTVGGVIKHVAAAERGWIDTVLQRNEAAHHDYAAYLANFRLQPGETLAGVLDLYEEAAATTEEVIAGIADLGQAVPVPQGVPWFPDDVEAWSVRWVLLHLIEETARHAGHADIVRECLDGASAVSLIAASEGWEATDWVQPWKPA